MAKLKSLLKIEGTLDGMTFYKKNGLYWVKTKGGIEPEKLKNDPAFARTRENNQEFSEIARANQFFRKVWAVPRMDVADNSVSNRVTSAFFKIIKFDEVSARGQRSIALAFETTEARTLFKGFTFNNKALLQAVLEVDVVIDQTTKELQLEGLHPNAMLKKVQGATHSTIVAYHANIDFAAEQKELVKSNVVEIAWNDPPTDINLAFPSLASGNGIAMMALKITFLQEINGVKYPLNNGAYNVLQLVAVG